jgi:hypothetical protein
MHIETNASVAQNDIKTLVFNFFNKLNIKIDTLEVTNVEKLNIFNIKIETEES